MPLEPIQTKTTTTLQSEEKKIQLPELLPLERKVTRGPDSNRYCIPAALSVMTNLHVDRIVELIREEIGEQPIEGIFYPLALKILTKLGYSYTRTRGITTTKSVYFVLMHDHCGVISNLYYYDNQYPNGTQHFPKMRVESIFEVWKGTR